MASYLSFYNIPQIKTADVFVLVVWLSFFAISRQYEYIHSVGYFNVFLQFKFVNVAKLKWYSLLHSTATLRFNRFVYMLNRWFRLCIYVCIFIFIRIKLWCAGVLMFITVWNIYYKCLCFVLSFSNIS